MFDMYSTPSFVIGSEIKELQPRGYRLVYYHNAKQLRARLSAQLYNGNLEGYYPDGQHALLLLYHGSMIAWLTYNEESTGKTSALHVVQMQAARAHRPRLPRNWPRLLLRSLMALGSDQVTEIRVRPARLLYWWYAPHGVAAEAVPALQERLRTYYDRIPAELGFEVVSDDMLDLMFASVPFVEPFDLWKEVYHCWRS